MLQEPETVENSHSISMTPPTNLATVIALVMLTALSPALGAGTSTSPGETHACVCLCLQLSFPLFYTRVCVLVGVIVLITLTPALGAGATVQGVDFAL